MQSSYFCARTPLSIHWGLIAIIIFVEDNKKYTHRLRDEFLSFFCTHVISHSYTECYVSRVTVTAENYEAVEKYRRFHCILASYLAGILWVGSSVCIISIYLWSSWSPNLWFPSILLGLWWKYGWLEGLNMDIIFRDIACQNFPLKFHRNFYQLWNFSLLLPLNWLIQFFLSAVWDIKLPRQSCLSFNIFYGDAVSSSLTKPESVLLPKRARFWRQNQFGPPKGR